MDFSFGEITRNGTGITILFRESMLSVAVIGPFYTMQFESVQYSLVLITCIILVCLLPILGTKRSIITSVMFWRHQRQGFETEKQS